jgi:HK97 family phage portal protein
VLTRIRNAFWAFRQSPNISLDQLDELIEMGGLGGLGERSTAGVRVSEQTGTRLSAVFGCIDVIGRDISSLPLKLYERTAAGGRAEVTMHPVAAWLKEPNPAQTPLQFRQRSWASTLASGNSYSQIITSPSGEIQTWPLNPHRIEKVFLGPDNRKRYLYHANGGTPQTLSADTILHNYGLSFNGWQGVSPIRWCMETVGRAIAIQEYAAAYFQSPVPKVVIKRDGDFTDEDFVKKFLRRWRKRFAGKRGLQTVAILPPGMSIDQIVKIPNEEAQFIETAAFSKEQIAGEIYHVPLHRLGDLRNAHFNNIEHAGIEYVQYTLMPWMTGYEQAIEKQFFTPAERERFFVRHNPDALMAGDFQTRMDGYSKARHLSTDEIRAKENMPTVEGGKEILVPLNYGALKDVVSPPEPAPDPPDDNDEDGDEDEDE